MRISRTRPVTGIDAVSNAPTVKRDESGQASESRNIQDTASVMGIPEAELTPKVREAIMTLMAEVDSLRKQLASAVSRLGEVERLADEDTLAPVYNRRAFVRELSRVMSYTERYGTPATLLFFDANNFKAINDTHGHAAGDQALMAIAQVLLDHVRDSDIVGRIGGDEFAVILSNADEAAGREKGENLVQIVRELEIHWEGKPIDLDVAVGVYGLRPGEDAGTALAQVDKAMYANKTAPKDGGSAE
jgi:diguanylate cyclase (GGDEF)-like protein